jgi:hypothetical protein
VDVASGHVLCHFIYKSQARLSLFNDISHYNERQECKPQEPRMSKAWNFATSGSFKK